jgi:hypothetical protein
VKAVAPLIDRQRENIFASFVGSPYTFSSTLCYIVTDLYGYDWIGWEPETLYVLLENRFGYLPEVNLHRLALVQKLFTSNVFYRSLPDFNIFCMLMNGSLSSPDTFGLASPEDIAWGMFEANFLRPADPKDGHYRFSEDILRFIASVYKKNGYIGYPEVIFTVLGEDQKLPELPMPDMSFDDPKLFAILSTNTRSKVEELNSYIDDQIYALFDQLHSLPLYRGNKKVLAEIFTKLSQARSSPS